MSETRNRDIPAFPQAVAVSGLGDSIDSEYAGGTGLTKLEYLAMKLLTSKSPIVITDFRDSLRLANKFFNELEKQKGNK